MPHSLPLFAAILKAVSWEMLTHLTELKYFGSWRLRTADELLHPNILSTHVSSQIYVGTAHTRREEKQVRMFEFWLPSIFISFFGVPWTPSEENYFKVPLNVPCMCESHKSWENLVYFSCSTPFHQHLGVQKEELKLFTGTPFLVVDWVI